MWYTSYYLNDTIADVLTLDKDCPTGLKETDWAGIHLDVIQNMVNRENKSNYEEYFKEGGLKA